MKTYENESVFVTTFCKDCKESLKSNGQFEAVVNGINVIVTGMDNNNSSKVTVYTGTVNGVAFSGSITALKKKLNVTFKKEYNRNSEAAKSAKTVVAIKSDEELQRTVEVSYDRLYNAVTSLLRIINRYELSGILNEDDICSIRNEGVICRGDDVIPVMELMMKKLRQERDEAIERKRIADEKAEAEKAEKQKAEAEKEAQRAALLAQIAEASANGKMALVIDLSKELAKLK